MRVLVFVPLDRADAAALRSGADVGARPGGAPTPGLRRVAGPDALPEEVEFAALAHAGVLAVTVGSDALRLVLAADVDPAQVSDSGDELGRVTVSGLRWSQVQSLFADEPAAAAAVARARTEVAGLGLDQALDAPAVAALLDASDLLWFARAELDAI